MVGICILMLNGIIKFFSRMDSGDDNNELKGKIKVMKETNLNKVFWNESRKRDREEHDSISGSASRLDVCMVER